MQPILEVWQLQVQELYFEGQVHAEKASVHGCGHHLPEVWQYEGYRFLCMSGCPIECFSRTACVHTQPKLACIHKISLKTAILFRMVYSKKILFSGL